MSLTCEKLVADNAEMWRSATIHPFLDGCRDGTIRLDQFHTWLVQDYRFVVEFTRFAARLLADAPVPHFDTLLGGLQALQDELTWFRAKAEERDLDLSTPPLPGCQKYNAMMAELHDAAYPVKATAFWAIERAYNEAWGRLGALDNAYGEFAERWGNEGFGEYVRALALQADEALANASADEVARATKAFVTVADYEQGFWQMAFAAG